MTHDRFGFSVVHTNGTLTHRLRSTEAPQPDGDLNNTVRLKNKHYKRIYDDLSEPVVFMSVTANTSGRINEESLRFVCFVVTQNQCSPTQ